VRCAVWMGSYLTYPESLTRNPIAYGVSGQWQPKTWAHPWARHPWRLGGLVPSPVRCADLLRAEHGMGVLVSFYCYALAFHRLAFGLLGFPGLGSSPACPRSLALYVSQYYKKLGCAGRHKHRPHVR